MTPHPFINANRFCVFIVHEQLKQVADSYANDDVHSNNNLTLYYNTIGNFDNSDFVDETCKEVGLNRCVRLRSHQAEGNEDMTLGDMHQYCLRDDYDGTSGSIGSVGSDEKVVAYIRKCL